MRHFAYWSLIHLFFYSAHLKAEEFGYSWKNCESQIFGGTTFPFTEDLKPRPECLPDTLYTWSRLARVEETLTHQKKGELFPVVGNLFLWRTPLGSYGYGETVIRFKLKPNMNFVPLFIKPHHDEDRFCKNIKKKYGKKIETTVFVARLSWNPGYYEYILCSDGPISSLSYGTPELLAEVLQEKTWIEEHNKEDFDLFFKNLPIPWIAWKTEHSVDGVDWSLKALEQKLQFLEDLSHNEIRGNKIFFKGPSTRKDHYNTETPNYFNSSLN
jgi:hypothetical protein